ncbi:hypothetical protein C5L14_29055 [Labrys okinawensis]|uniref:Uncharacterized protein n=1 Tax=Labrys okinawensis TaxID=346911 RepID=A0A2S9Q433_9HYPH|nr:DUF6880 family protein [Labrys okinawensis]PRH84121.1 hypothetical protein C5L14_29055 [Labrys okinawensis]
MAAKSKLTPASLAELGPAKLAELIVEEAQANPAFRKRVTAALAGAQGPEAVAKLVERRLAALEKARSFIDWPKIKEFEKDLAATLANIIGEIGPGSAPLAVDLLLRFIATAADVFARALSSNRLEDLYNEAVSALGPLATRLEPADLAGLPDRVMALTDRAGDIAPALIASLLEQASAADLDRWDRLLADKVATLQSAYRAGPYRELRQAIAVRRDDLDAWIALENEKPRESRDGLAVAEKLLAAGRAEEALSWLDIEEPSRLAYADALDLADGVVRRDFRLPARSGLKARILEVLGRRQEAQELRWATFEATLDPGILRAYLARLDDFAEFEVLDRAFAHALTAKTRYRALHFLTEWPRLDHAARLVLDFGLVWDGSHYQVLQWVADRLQEEQPLAASLLYRALVEDILMKGKSAAYGHGAAYLARLDDLATRLDPAALSKLGRLSHADWRAYLRQQHGRKASFWAAVAR